ncbi:MMPL family transporter [soil metagenome]
MFGAIGRFCFDHRWSVIGIWVAAFVVAAPFLLKVDEPLKVGGFFAPDTESVRAATLLEQELGTSPSTMVVIFTSESLQTSDLQFHAQVRYALQPVRELSRVTTVLLPEDDDALIAENGRMAYALIGLDRPAEEAQRDVQAFNAALRTPLDLDLVVAGAPAFYADIETVSQRDLRRAELIAFPFALIALLIVFGSLVAASVPLIVGGAGVAAVLFTLYVIAHFVDLSIFVLNLATMLGLGLAVDYSLFVTSRYREELPKHNGNVQSAVVASTATAGRAIFFSGLTVLIGLSGLVLFDFMFLRSVGIAGVVVVVFSVAAALTLLPATLGVVGGNIERFRILPRVTWTVDPSGGFWVRLSLWVMRHPWRVLVPTTALLLVLGAPFARVEVSSPDATILPRDLPSRQAFDMMVDAYGPGEISPFVITVESDSGIFDSENLAAIYDLSAALTSDPRISHIRSLAPTSGDLGRDQALALMELLPELSNIGVAPQVDQLANDRVAVIYAFSNSFANSDENKALLTELRARDPGGDLHMLVGGGSADIVDVVDKMYGQFPWAILLVVSATFVVLLILFRSVLLPLKAIVLNTMSILASYGALVFIFQDGHFQSILGFERMGFVEASLPVIMFCVLFGLSMDYEVFLLSRIREEWDRTSVNETSVALGLQRSGRIITSAALIVVVVTTSFATAEVILIKALGLGIALAVFIDATVVRALMVPATMRLMGEWNWWLPRRIDRRLPRLEHEEINVQPVTISHTAKVH